MNMNDVTDMYQPPVGSDLSLLPCPFCGSISAIYAKYSHESGDRWAVVCMGCMASVDPGYAQHRFVVQDMWNRRTITNGGGIK